MDQVTEALGQNLAYSAPFLRYGAAGRALSEDGAATALLRELGRLQGELRRRQNQGAVTAGDLARLRQVQADVQANAVIADYLRAQQEVTLYVQEINAEISNLLGVDFAGLARVSGC
jgi:cell fate (sporulation/competence/biofilm development) regulator YlbF (YheA/YmcA/DUF963 family)